MVALGRKIARRHKALEALEEAVGHYLRRHDAPDLRAAYIEAKESKP